MPKNTHPTYYVPQGLYYGPKGSYLYDSPQRIIMEGTRWKNVVYVRKTGKHGMETRENTGKHVVYVRKHGKTRIGGVSDS